MAEEKKKAKGRTVDKWKKKKEYTIYLPDIFDKKEIGKTIAEKNEQLINRTLTVSLRDILKEAKRAPYLMTFKINNIQGQNAYTIAKAYDIQPSFLRRNVRRRISKIDTMQKLKTNDNVEVKVKTMTITVKKAKRAQETAIRKIILEKIKNEVTTNSFSKLLQNVISDKLVNDIVADTKKIYPIRRFEFVQIASN